MAVTLQCRSRLRAIGRFPKSSLSKLGNWDRPPQTRSNSCARLRQAVKTDAVACVRNARHRPEFQITENSGHFYFESPAVRLIGIESALSVTKPRYFPK
jgi:hypothetical protein